MYFERISESFVVLVVIKILHGKGGRTRVHKFLTVGYFLKAETTTGGLALLRGTKNSIASSVRARSHKGKLD